MPLTMGVIGGGAGLLNYNNQMNQYAQQMQLAAATQRYSPWTGLKANIPTAPSAIGDVGQGALSGAGMGMQAQNNSALNNWLKGGAALQNAQAASTANANVDNSLNSMNQSAAPQAPAIGSSLAAANSAAAPPPSLGVDMSMVPGSVASQPLTSYSYQPPSMVGPPQQYSPLSMTQPSYQSLGSNLSMSSDPMAEMARQRALGNNQGFGYYGLPAYPGSM